MPSKKTKRRPKKTGTGSQSGWIIVFLCAVIAVQGFLLWKPESAKRLKNYFKGLSASSRTPLPPKKAIVPRPAAPPRKTAKTTPVRGRIAIIIDDSGYSHEDCSYLKNIRTPVTLSVLPELPYSRDNARCAHQAGQEVMLHLPLEPHVLKQTYPEDYIITTDMPADKIVRLFHQCLESVPYAIGVNNHMGSKATENTRLLSILFSQMKKSHLFFIDSRVTAETLCPQMAKKQGLPFAERDVFLDNHNDRAYIIRQFEILARKAEEQGTAIGIGHARPLTWEIIKEEGERLSQKGFRFVFAKDLTR